VQIEVEACGDDRPGHPGRSRAGRSRAGRTNVDGTRAQAGDGEAGLSLLELVIAMTVFVILILGVVASIDSGLTLTRNNAARSVAANLASQEMDTVRSTAFTALTARTVTEVVGSTTYSINRQLTWVSKSATNGPCDGSNANPELLRVRVTVTWPAMRGVAPVVSDTTLSPPVGAYSANSGHIAVKVLDGTGAGEFGTAVQINGPMVQSEPTNSDGCAFFAFLTPGTYTVSLNTVGYVNRQSLQNPSQTVGVTVGNVSSVQFDYDQAATLSLTFAADAGGTIPSDIPVTLGNTQFLPSGVKTYAGSGLTRSIGSLFPAADGYTVWAGSCADADPEGQLPSAGGPYWPTGQRADPLDAPRGVTTAGTVALKTAAITVTGTGGLPLVGATVVATHAVDQSCGAGETHVLGTTDATGLLNTALPFGTWQLTVTGHSPNPTWPSLVLDPTASTTPSVHVSTL
jgi:Tfp pilus assembly protein PilV